MAYQPYHLKRGTEHELCTGTALHICDTILRISNICRGFRSVVKTLSLPKLDRHLDKLVEEMEEHQRPHRLRHFWRQCPLSDTIRREPVEVLREWVARYMTLPDHAFVDLCRKSALDIGNLYGEPEWSFQLFTITSGHDLGTGK